MVVNRRIEGLGGGTVSTAQDVAATDPGQPTGPRHDQTPERAHAADQVRIGAFARAAFRHGDGIELEAADQVVGEDAELLPGTVGPVVARGDDVEGELVLELGDGSPGRRALLYVPDPEHAPDRLAA